MCRVVFIACVLFSTSIARGQSSESPLLFREDFEKDASRWQPLDAGQWTWKKADSGHVFSQHVKAGKYKPPHRSPVNIALLKDVVASDFEFTAKVLSTHEDYGHRDACVVFGYQDPKHFYYVHLGRKTDAHANQIFIVNDAARVKISLKTSEGTPWDEKWHTVRVSRDVKSGKIEIFFDDLKNPVMTAEDKTFAWGGFGIGTFDDTSDWDDVEIRGVKHVKE